MRYRKRRACRADAFTGAKGDPVKNCQKGQQKREHRDLGIHFVLQPIQERHKSARRENSAHRKHQPARLAMVRWHKAQAGSRQQKYHAHQHRRLVHGHAAIGSRGDGGRLRCAGHLRPHGGSCDLQEQDANQRESRSHAETYPHAAVNSRFQHRVRRVIRRIMHGNLFSSRITIEDSLRVFRGRRHLANGDFAGRVICARHLIRVSDIRGVGRATAMARMGFNLC